MMPVAIDFEKIVDTTVIFPQCPKLRIFVMHTSDACPLKTMHPAKCLHLLYVTYQMFQKEHAFPGAWL